MSIILKSILLILGILAFVGCIFWWIKEGGWEPKVATMGAMSTVLVLIFNLTQKENASELITIHNNTNSPVANKIENQTNNYNYKPDAETFTFTSNLEIKKQSKNCLFINFRIDNKSLMPGTKPLVQIWVYGIENKNNDFELIWDKDIAEWDKAPKSFEMKRIFNGIPLTGAISTSKEFSEKILYPNDNLTVFSPTKKNSSIKMENVKYVIGRIDTRFKEAIPESKYYLYNIEKEGVLDVVMESNDDNLSDLINKYLKLIN